MDIKKGKELISLARKAIYENLAETKEFPEKRGVFVTLHTFPERKLRGCIGYPLPVLPLGLATIKAAKSAAFQDPRFPALKKEEQVVIDVSVFSKLQKIQPAPENIKIGKDGLIVKYGPFSGLLLPIVAVEHKMNAEQFLKETCYKAGLNPSVLKDKNCQVFKFQTEVFSEEKPNGRAVKLLNS